MPSNDVNRQWLLANRPVGWPKESDFKLAEGPVPEPGRGEVLVRTLWLSVDPYMRGRMRDVKSYAPPVPVGGVMEGGAVAKVLASDNPKFVPADIVEGRFGWQDYAVSDGKGVRKIDPTLAPVSSALGVLGMPGLTAYFGLLDICRPKPGETVLVSGAAGAVGSLVGQIAKIKGARSVGIAGSDDKVRWITEELGFDAGFNYKTVPNYGAKIAELCPNGVDCYFDNVGGEITDAVFPLLNPRARVAVCGQISQYNMEKLDQGPRLLWHFVRQQLKVEGFLVFQFADRYKEGLNQLAKWLTEERIRYRETVVEGLEHTPAAFLAMMRGENIGKQVVHVADA
jgi:NADPH-dependent curcumin reductase CurA